MLGAIGVALALLVASGQGPLGSEGREESPRQALPAASASTVSVGHPYYGKLRDGIKLPLEGPYHVVQRSTRYRKWIYGTSYLIRSILVAAEHVDRDVPGGVPLQVGNLSRRGGGDIKMSMSHNTGRDVDVAYYTLDAKGNSVTGRYENFGADGWSKTARGRYKIDVARNWAWVRSMMSSDEAEVQWVIVAPYIERMLLEHARAIGEPDWMVRRAERMMMLPGWAKLHDNHIHLRVLCSPADWKRGCKNAGPVWPWNTRMLSGFDEVRERVRPKLASDVSADRIDAIDHLVRRDVGTAVVDIAPALSDPEEAVRSAALKALVALATEANARALLEVARWAEPKVATKLLATALPLAGRDGVGTARQLVEGEHPAQSGKVKRRTMKKLVRTARRLLSRYGDERGQASQG